MKKIIIFTTVVLILSACSSNQPVAVSPAADAGRVEAAAESNVQVQARQAIIEDWKGRLAQAPSIPQWITDIQLNRFDDAANFLREGDVGNSIFRGLTTTGPDLRGAEMRADAAFARTIARELQQSINSYLASSANSMDGPTTEAIKDISQVKSEVQISGARIVNDHWQNVIDVDPASGARTRQTVLYRFYAFQRADWAAITGGYVQTVLNQLPQRLRPEEKDVTDMLQNMLTDARHPIVMSQQEREAELEAQQKMIDAQVNIAPAQQRDAARIELAKINSETAITLGQQRADASVARADAYNASNAEEMAYASGSPILRSAAATTIADRELVNAARLAARIIF